MAFMIILNYGDCIVENKISICGIVGIPGNYGGFETFAENLVKNTKNNYKFIVYCDKNFQCEDGHVPDNVTLVRLPLKANGWQSVFFDALCMLCSIKSKSTVLLLGCSGGAFVPIVRFFGVNVITNIAGLEWKRSKWGRFASMFLKLSEKVAVRFSNIVVTDNQELQAYVRDTYLTESNVIAYGADHVSTNTSIDIGHLVEKYALTFNDYFISVGRCQPDNNIREIVGAFVKSSQNLIAVSNWSSCKYGLDILKDFSNYSNIKLLDPVYDIDEISALRLNAKGYIHGHSAGGTNPTLVEAMYLGIPILAYDVKFNRYTTDNNALFWSNRACLRELLNNYSKDDMDESVSFSLKYAKKYYTWEFISNEYMNLFDKVKKR